MKLFPKKIESGIIEIIKVHYCFSDIQEVTSMATKSILKNVNIKDKRLARTFIDALSEAEKTKYDPPKLSRECRELTDDKIKEFFGK